MKFLLSLAWKNLSRYRRRTIITACALAVGLTLFIFTDALLKGMEKESERNLIWYETSSAKILNREYFNDRKLLTLTDPINEYQALHNVLREESADFTPRIVFSAELLVYEDPYPGDGSLMVKAAAVSPESDDSVYRFQETVTEGRYLEKGEDGILLGSWLAEDLHAEVGYPVTLVTRTKSGYYQTIDMEIVGIYTCPNPYVNRSTVFLPISSAMEYLEMDGSVTEVGVKFPMTADIDKEAEDLRTLINDIFPDLEVYTWKELAPDYIQLAAGKQAGSKTILLLVLIIAVVGISNTMLMAIYERVRELGMMRALGMDDRKIRRTFLLEAAGIGFIGSLLGIALGSLITWYFVNNGIDMTAFTRNMDIGYRTSGIMRPAWNFSTIIISFIAGILISVGVAFVPTRRAMKMEIAECLRHQ